MATERGSNSDSERKDLDIASKIGDDSSYGNQSS